MGRILIDGQPGSGFKDQCMPMPGELVVSKPGKDAFDATPLNDYLHRRGITNLIFTGATTEVCVQTSMRAANDRGYDCLLVEDGTGSYFPDYKHWTLKMIVAQGGIIGWTAPAKEILQTLARRHLLGRCVTRKNVAMRHAQLFSRSEWASPVGG